MADKKKMNIFKKIRQRFVEVRQELKRVNWPTRDKMIQTSVIVLAVIVAATVLLTLVSQGGTAILDKIGFYGQVQETTTVATTTAASEESTSDTSEETVSEDTSAEETEETEAS